MNARRIRAVGALMVAALVVGCASDQVTDERGSERIAEERALVRIEEARAAGETARAWSLLQRAARDGVVGDGQRDRLEAALSDDVARVEVDAARAGDARALARARWNAAVFAGREPERDEILLEWARVALDRDDEVTALALLARRSRLDDLTVLEEARVAEAARRVEDRTILRRLGEDSLPQVTAPRQLSGLTTVWVDRGMRIENGVGIPDRVIGSAFFVDDDGLLMTNYHVISSEVDPTYEGYSRLYVRLPGRPEERVPARVVGWDRVLDLALLKVEIDAPFVFTFETDRSLLPGTVVRALGSPGGLDSSITSGIVSATGRRFLQIGEVVQVDAPINPGNSGGPLVGEDGETVGVVFAGIEQFEGVNFAIPAAWAERSLLRMRAGGEVSHPWFGVALAATRDGLRATYVDPNGPAAVAGVQVGDILEAIAGEEVDDIVDGQQRLADLDHGYLIPTQWYRDGEAVSIPIVTGPRPYSPLETVLGRSARPDLFPVLFGFSVDEIDGSLWGPDYIIRSVFPGTIADESSLSVDDPLALRDWRVDEDRRVALIQIVVKKRKAGFLESGLQLGAPFETNAFL